MHLGKMFTVLTPWFLSGMGIAIKQGYPQGSCRVAWITGRWLQKEPEDISENMAGNSECSVCDENEGNIMLELCSLEKITEQLAGTNYISVVLLSALPC